MGQPFSDACKKAYDITQYDAYEKKGKSKSFGYSWLQKDFFNYNIMDDMGYLSIAVINYQLAESTSSSPVNYLEHTYVETGSFDDTSPFAVEGIHVGFKYYNVSDVMTKRDWKEVHHESG